ncbi:hypothetical protein IE4803_CH03397 [Rhizobium etli bv. phaseoli str. IE4803]|uniref:Uncharacterized protein n=1 Tax=Rhizobium etli bv. mimosae str. IE4771 TaxID=1432050 RepID=A0A060HZX9_RHIET|nr:hypothetical protein IE4771_CH03437 [Rhizobium sp. IE4771]AJC80565.1 hypothetical protein IE4803_CH03397 [Rhizobium etli bv. phaseoli str. IE4803]ARQ59465.1 hypothetical protein Kim5_CH03442 [Rhizobium sp. Kim5]
MPRYEAALLWAEGLPLISPSPLWGGVGEGSFKRVQTTAQLPGSTGCGRGFQAQGLE